MRKANGLVSGPRGEVTAAPSEWRRADEALPRFTSYKPGLRSSRDSSFHSRFLVA